MKLSPKISLENVFKILKFATALGLDIIFQFCCGFINTNLKSVLESVRLNELTTKSWECILEIRIVKNSITVKEIDLFNYLLKWMEQNSEKIEKEQIPLIFGKVRLEFIDITDLIKVVRKSNIYNADIVLDAIEKKFSTKTLKCSNCSYLIK